MQFHFFKSKERISTGNSLINENNQFELYCKVNKNLKMCTVTILLRMFSENYKNCLDVY